MMDNFIEYLFKSILEAAQNGDDLPIYFSDNLRDIFQSIEEDTNNEVATRLLYEEGKNSKKVYIDIDEDSIDRVSFLVSNKAEEILGRRDHLQYLHLTDYDKIWNARQRGTMKINRFINDLFNNEYKTKQLTEEEKEFNKTKGIKTASQHLEDFVNQFKSIREPGEFEIVKGSDIPKWYQGDYSETGNGTLGGSCMNDVDCQEYLKFYEHNKKISMLIMKSKKGYDKIIGRALIWELDIPSGRTFMDRVYTNNDYDVDNFKKYAKDKGWLYRTKQNYDEGEDIFDTVTGISKHIPLIIKNIIEGTLDDYLGQPLYPYMDTMKFYSPGHETISNQLEALPEKSKILKLEGTTGTDYYTITNRTFQELKEIYYNEINYNVKEYVGEFPMVFWNCINDDDFLAKYIEEDVQYKLTDFKYIYDDDEPKEYIENNVTQSDIPDNLDDMSIGEIEELMDDLGIKEEFVQSLVDERYSGYSAEEIHEEIYGDSDDITPEIYDAYQTFFDDDKFCREVTDLESEESLRERYPGDEE